INGITGLEGVALQKLQVQHFLEIMAREHHTEPLLLFFTGALRQKRVFNDFGLTGNTATQCGHRADVVLLEQLRLKPVHAGLHVERRVHHHNLILRDAQVLALNVLQLLVHNADTDDQRYRNDKLPHHQGLPQKVGMTRSAGLALEHFRRLKRGEYKRWVAAGQQPRHQAYSQDARHQRRVGECRQAYGLSGQVIEPWQYRRDHAHGDHQREQAGQYRLAHKLADEHFAVRTHNLTQPHRPGALGRPRGGQVHKIDHGDHQDEQRDEREEIYVLDVPVTRELQLDVGCQVDVVGLLYVQRHAGVGERGGVVAFDEVGQARLDLLCLFLVFNGEVQPCRHPNPLSLEEGLVVEEVLERIQRTEHIELEVGVVGQVADDARYLHVDEVVKLKSLSYRIFRSKVFRCC